MLKTAAGIALAIALLAGCATATDLRSRPADLSMTVPGQYDSIAECVAHKADAIRNIPSILRYDRAAKKAYLYEPVGSMGSAAFDITFAQNGDVVQIDARGMSTIYGSQFHPAQVWPAVRQCAGGK